MKKVLVVMMLFLAGCGAKPLTKFAPGDRVVYTVNGQAVSGIVFDMYWSSPHWVYKVKTPITAQAEAALRNIPCRVGVHFYTVLLYEFQLQPLRDDL